MCYTIDEIRNKTVPIAKFYGVKSLGLFGSYARNEATDDSDVDLCVEKGSLRSLLQYFSFVHDLEKVLGCHEYLERGYSGIAGAVGGDSEKVSYEIYENINYTMDSYLRDNSNRFSFAVRNWFHRRICKNSIFFMGHSGLFASVDIVLPNNIASSALGKNLLERKAFPVRYRILPSEIIMLFHM